MTWLTVCKAVACGLGTGEQQQGPHSSPFCPLAPSSYSGAQTVFSPKVLIGPYNGKTEGHYSSCWKKPPNGGSEGSPYPVNLPWSPLWLWMRSVMDWRCSWYKEKVEALQHQLAELCDSPHTGCLPPSLEQHALATSTLWHACPGVPLQAQAGLLVTASTEATTVGAQRRCQGASQLWARCSITFASLICVLSDAKHSSIAYKLERVLPRTLQVWGSLQAGVSVLQYGNSLCRRAS